MKLAEDENYAKFLRRTSEGDKVNVEINVSICLS